MWKKREKPYEISVCGLYPESPYSFHIYGKSMDKIFFGMENHVENALTLVKSTSSALLTGFSYPYLVLTYTSEHNIIDKPSRWRRTTRYCII